MDKDNRKYRFCFIDYMWYVAEIWHERERTNLNGRMPVSYTHLDVYKRQVQSRFYQSESVQRGVPGGKDRPGNARIRGEADRLSLIHI